VLVSYPAGRVSDRMGRRGVIVLGYLCYGLVYLGFALGSGAALWALFGLYGVYGALTQGVEKALITDLAPRHLRGSVHGLHATIVGLGLLPASLLAGAVWQLVSPQATFFVGGLTGLLAALGMAWVLRVPGS
jgi:MFS family permease